MNKRFKVTGVLRPGPRPWLYEADVTMTMEISTSSDTAAQQIAWEICPMLDISEIEEVEDRSDV